eukprot:1931991-Prymnesium_polylepis.1
MINEPPPPNVVPFADEVRRTERRSMERAGGAGLVGVGGAGGALSRAAEAAGGAPLRGQACAGVEGGEAAVGGLDEE